MINRHHEILTSLSGKAITGKSALTFASGPLELDVIFTDPQTTSAALTFAQSFARELGAHICLRATIAVPLQFPLDRSPVSVAFVQEALRNLVSQLDGYTFEPTVHLYLCRDRVPTLLQVLRRNSLVVLGGRKRWWPTAASRLARALRAEGHRVIVVDSRAQTASEQPVFAR